MEITYIDNNKKAEDYTKKYEKEICPCGNCGSTDVQIVYSLCRYPKTRDTWYIICNACKSRTDAYSSVKRAVIKWNTKN